MGSTTGQPEIVKRLREYNHSIRQVPRLGIRTRAVTSAILRASEAVRVQEGLLTNDSITVAMMRGLELTAVATYDADLKGLEVSESTSPATFPEVRW
jgi:predicted nucleic acid-binding protein